MADKSLNDGGQECSDDAAAGCLSQGHPKTGSVATAWGMKDQQNDGDGPDDDARVQSFNKSK